MVQTGAVIRLYIYFWNSLKKGVTRLRTALEEETELIPQKNSDINRNF